MCDDARVKIFRAVQICNVANLVKRCRAETYAAGGFLVLTKFTSSINCELDIVTAFRQLSIRAVVGVNLPPIGTFLQGLIDTE